RIAKNWSKWCTQCVIVRFPYQESIWYNCFAIISGSLTRRWNWHRLMKSDSPNPLHRPETEFHGELQEFSGPALSPDDPTLEPRLRKGRPSDQKQSPDSNTDDGQDTEH